MSMDMYIYVLYRYYLIILIFISLNAILLLHFYILMNTYSVKGLDTA